MLRPLQVGMSLPIQYPVDPNATFEAGMICQFKKVGNEVVLGVSDGIAPFGIIDDIRNVAFTQPVIDEIVIIRPAQIAATDGYVLVAAADTLSFLAQGNVLPQSFSSDTSGVQLLAPANGALFVPAGTPLNYKADPTSIYAYDSVRAIVRYAYYVPNRPGTDTTIGSHRITVWHSRGGIFQTDQYETTVPYAINAPLYASVNGKWTTEQLLDNQPAVGMVIIPPTSVNPVLEFIFG